MRQGKCQPRVLHPTSSPPSHFHPLPVRLFFLFFFTLTRYGYPITICLGSLAFYYTNLALHSAFLD